MADKLCSGDCLKCSFQQQVYCSAQHCHAIMALMPNIIERIDRLESAMLKFNAGEVFNPLEKKAQDDAGAENRAQENVEQ